MSTELESALLELAINHHKIEDGEYGCNGASCPGVQRLLLFAKRAVEAAGASREADHALAERLEQAAFQNACGQPYPDDGPEMTWAELDELATLLHEAAADLRPRSGTQTGEPT